MYSSRKYFLANYDCSGNAFQLSTGALYAEKECGRQGRPAPSTGNNFDFETFGNRDQNTNNIFDNVLGQQQVRGSNPGSNNGSNCSTIAQLPDVNVDSEDPLPGYTPSSNFGNCAADNLDTAYEKVVDVTYNRGTVTELTTRRVLPTLVK